MSNFTFLTSEWPEVHEAALRAENEIKSDPRTACFYARRALELEVKWVFKADSSLSLPYEDNLSALLHDPGFKQSAGDALFTKARLITRFGNQAVHSNRRIPESDALAAVRELFQFSYWLAWTYARGSKPPPQLVFDASLIPDREAAQKQTGEKLLALENSLHERDEKLTSLLVDRADLDAELVRLREEIAVAKKANAVLPDTHDYSEAETRDLFIDLLLRESGWLLDQPRDREFEVAGMPNAPGKGYVDYVLWGDDGLPLAVVEAKRTKKDSRIGQRQAELYADCLEKQFGRRPVIFFTNGYTHWLWDDQMYPPREVQGFLTKDELELMIQRRSTRKPLSLEPINTNIVERYYQERAIRRISSAFAEQHERKALLVMATGAGKTRTVIALCDLLTRCNWVKRTLFLADRVALVNQAVGAFKKHLPDSSPVNLVTDKEAEGRVYVSTYPTMMGLIDETRDGQRRFGVGHFELVVIDEAHRSVYQKYGAIFDYFDSYLVGLTATPKDEVDINTYQLFDLERGVPTDAYPLDDAINDGFLVPPLAVTVPGKFQREGIAYKDLSEEEKDEWDAIEWDEEGNRPEKIEPAALNAWLFNRDTVDKVLADLMNRGITVAGGDRLGKTIIFAKNQAHAQFIVERFDTNYPHLKGAFARGIYHSVPYAQTLIDDFAISEKAPHIAISVDMLDTGIDIPEVVNLVFFKMVRSKTKFWQMVGRGTRLRPDLFGPGQDKANFYILDYCGNLEFFNLDLPATQGRIQDSLGKRLFVTRLELIGEIDRQGPEADATSVRVDAAGLLHEEVAAMNVDNFVVRPKRKYVEQYKTPEAWEHLHLEDLTTLADEVAGLPSELDAEDEDAKRFDLLMLNLQLAVLRIEPSFARLRDQVKAIAGLLDEQASIPMIRQQLELIEDLQSDEWWQDVTVPMLEHVRLKLRALIRLIEKRKRAMIFTNFEDALGSAETVTLLATPPTRRIAQDFDKEYEAVSTAPETVTVTLERFERFKQKARAFLRKHDDNLAIYRLRTNKPLTATDLESLEAMLAENGIGDAAVITKAAEDSQGLGLFVRGLVGLDRGAAKEAFAGFLAGKTLSANQIEFVDLIINYLTDHGVMSAARLYESPFTDIAPHGPDDLFTFGEIDDLVRVLSQIRSAAVAA